MYKRQTSVSRVRSSCRRASASDRPFVRKIAAQGLRFFLTCFSRCSPSCPGPGRNCFRAFATQVVTSDVDRTGRFQTLNQGPDMTSPSFQSGQTDGRCTFDGWHEVACSTSSSKEDTCAALSTVYATETLRMKAFVGQKKFQAPVADDFARGLHASGPADNANAHCLRRPIFRWAALINGLCSRLRGQTPG